MEIGASWTRRDTLRTSGEQLGVPVQITGPELIDPDERHEAEASAIAAGRAGGGGQDKGRQPPWRRVPSRHSINPRETFVHLTHRRCSKTARLCLAASVLVTASSRPATGQEAYPDRRREVRHIIPWGAGGATDAAMRGVAQYLEKQLGVPVVSENVAGGLSAVGLLHVKTARPDGYTIGTMTYDVLTLEFQGLAPVSWGDFAVVGMVTDHPSALIVPADRWATVAEFRAAVQAQPRSIKVGNVGTGGIWHQHAAAMGRALDLSVTHVPYEAGSGAQLAALLGGEVDAIVASLPAALPYVRDGTLRVLAIMSTERDDLIPEVPTFTELGHHLVFGGFRVLVAPRGTPEPIVSHLEQALHAAMNDREFETWAKRAAIGVRWRDRQETEAYLEELAGRVRTLIRGLGLIEGRGRREEGGAPRPQPSPPPSSLLPHGVSHAR